MTPALKLLEHLEDFSEEVPVKFPVFEDYFVTLKESQAGGTQTEQQFAEPVLAPVPGTKFASIEQEPQDFQALSDDLAFEPDKPDLFPDAQIPEHSSDLLNTDPAVGEVSADEFAPGDFDIEDTAGAEFAQDGRVAVDDLSGEIAQIDGTLGEDAAFSDKLAPLEVEMGEIARDDAGGNDGAPEPVSDGQTVISEELPDVAVEAEAPQQSAEDILREHYEGELAQRFASSLAQAEQELTDLVTDSVAGILAGLLNEELVRKSIDALAVRLHETMRKDGALRIEVRGPHSLFDKFKQALGDSVAEIQHTDDDGPDLVVEVDSQIVRTRIGEWRQSVEGYLS